MYVCVDTMCIVYVCMCGYNVYVWHVGALRSSTVSWGFVIAAVDQVNRACQSHLLPQNVHNVMCHVAIAMSQTGRLGDCDV